MGAAPRGFSRSDEGLPPTELVGCADLREATQGCRVVILAATVTEAEPILDVLSDARRYLVATKSVTVGWLGEDGGGSDLGPRVVMGVGGCDKANAAHLLTCLLQAMEPAPSLVLQTGIAGAFTGGGHSHATPGDVVLATEEIYADTGSSSPDGWLSAGELGLPIAHIGGMAFGNGFLLDEGLVRAAARAVEGAMTLRHAEHSEPHPRVIMGACVSASQVTGLRADGIATARRWGAVAETMEGTAAAHLCALYGVPFVEVRGISNLVVDRDRGSWEVARAVEVSSSAALAICRALDTLPLAGAGIRPKGA